MSVERALLPVSDWKRLTVINCKFTKAELTAQIPFLQPFDYNCKNGDCSELDIAKRILEKTKEIFPYSDFAIQETIMYEGQLEDCLKSIYPSKHYLRFQWRICDDMPTYEAFVDDDIEVVKIPVVRCLDELVLEGFSLGLNARMPAGSEATCMPLILCAEYDKEEETEILRQLKDIEKV